MLAFVFRKMKNSLWMTISLLLYGTLPSVGTMLLFCVLLVIGPAGLSSVEYPRRIPGAIVVDNLDCLYSSLNEVVSAPAQLPVQAASIRKFAEEHHRIDHVRARLHQDFSKLL